MINKQNIFEQLENIRHNQKTIEQFRERWKALENFRNDLISKTSEHKLKYKLDLVRNVTKVETVRNTWLFFYKKQWNTTSKTVLEQIKKQC